MKLLNSRFGDLFTHTMLLVAFLTISSRLETTQWVPGLEKLEILIFTGYICGILFGISKFKIPFVILLSAFYALLGVTLQAFTLVESKMMGFRDKLLVIIQRLGSAFYYFGNNLPVDDPILFYFALGILLWITTGAAAFFFVRKKSPWVPLGLCMIYLLLIDYFPPFEDHPGRQLLFFVFIAMMIIGRIWYLRQQDTWVKRGYKIESDTGFNLAKSILFGSLVVVFISWNITTAVDLFVPGSESRIEMSELWISIRSRILNVFASLDAPFYSATDFYENTMRLGSTIPEGNEILFLVNVPDRDRQDLRFFWRGHSYNTYQNGEWINTQNQQEQAYGTLLESKTNILPGRRAVELEFELRAGLSRTLYLPTVPAYVNRNVLLIGYEMVGENVVDMMSVQPISPIRQGGSYSATVYVSQPTITQLRQAGTQYPGWVVDTYLQIPENFPERIQQLAREIVKEETTPYDQVAAITQYLRSEISYEPRVDIPDQVEEPIDWMLFNSKTGFCNYYATAEVLMLRSIGIPARFSAGYAQGEPVGDSYYNVRVRDSHAWPEVYFPKFGWVEFEPTAAQPARDLPVGDELIPERNPQANVVGGNLLAGNESSKDIDALLDDEGSGYATRSHFLWVKNWLWLIIILIIMAGALITKRFVLVPQKITFPGLLKRGVEKTGFDIPKWLTSWAVYVNLSTVQKMNVKLTLWIDHSGLKSESGATLQEKFKPVTQKIPEINELVQQFVQLYYQDQYSRTPVDQTQIRQLYQMIVKALFQYWFYYRFTF
jgi:transglutaminase-like putative cysteine protease